MDSAPVAGQLRRDAVDTRSGILDHHHQIFHRSLGHAQEPSSSVHCPTAERAPNSLYHDRFPTDASQRASSSSSSPHSHPSTCHDPVTVDNHHAPPPCINSNDFYNHYRSPGAKTNPDVPPMAATPSSRPSLRLNGDASASGHPAPLADHRLPRTNLRSFSSPLDNKSHQASSGSRMPSGKPSVKDLKKRFDQNTVLGVSTIPPHPSLIASGLQSTKPWTGISNQGSPHSASTARGSPKSTQDNAVEMSNTPPSQSQNLPEDHTSRKTRSFASRVGKPRNLTGTEPAPRTSTASPPMPHSRVVSISSTPRALPSQKILFGEVRPEQHDPNPLGHGIDRIGRRRTSDSTVQVRAAHTRGFDRNAESPSPSPSMSSLHRGSPSQPKKGHGISAARSRALSDDSGSSPSMRVARNYVSRSSQQHSSKLPLSVRTLSSRSNSMSPTSTRSSSPPTVRRYQANGQLSRMSPAAVQTKTPIRNRKGAKPTSSDARPQAHVAAPTSKYSPAFRNPRSKQAVSTSSNSPLGLEAPSNSESGNRTNQSARRRKISIGPVDFEQRREHIRLAYSKTIQESEALEARHKAVARGTQTHQEMTSPSQQANETWTTKTSPYAPDAPKTLLGSPKSDVNRNAGYTNVQILSDANVSPSVSDGDLQSHGEVESARLIASPALSTVSAQQKAAIPRDHPTPGLPGSFPDQSSRPVSAVSATSDTTEFDNEPQTNLPVQVQSPTGSPISVLKPSSPPVSQLPHARTEYIYPFEPFEEDPASPMRTPHRERSQNSFALDLFEASAGLGATRGDTQKFNVDAIGPDALDSQEMSASQPPPNQDGSPLIASCEPEIPFPRLGRHYDSDSLSEDDQPQRPGNDHLGVDTFTDSCTEEINDGNRGRDDLRRRSYYDTRVRSCRNSLCASSDVGTYEDIHISNDDDDQPRQLFDVASDESQLVSASQNDNHRLSRHSARTDCSEQSTGQSDRRRSLARQANRESPAIDQVKTPRPQANPSSPNVARRHRSEPREPDDSGLAATHYASLHLPEVDTGDGFSVPYPTSEPRPEPEPELELEPIHHGFYVPLPSHEPPPIPSSALDSGFNSRTSSAFYDQSQYGSTLLNSERASDELMTRTGTAQSVESASLAMMEQYTSLQSSTDRDGKPLATDGGELTDQERHRLIQRRNVIKELVDTEAVFVRDMNIVEEIYKGTAEACPKLDGKTVKLIFRNSDEIIAFHTSFLAEIREAVAEVYVPKGASVQRGESSLSTATTTATTTATSPTETDDARDRCTYLGPAFKDNMAKMKLAHEGFLRASDQAAKRLIQIQQDPTVQVWLNECNEVAKDLTAAWDLDSLLIKPMQRITKYPNIIITLLQHTPKDHPDRKGLEEAKDILETAIIEINKSKKNFELVGQIVGRKRKESDVKAGFARAFGKRVDKLQASNSRPVEDADYAKLNEKFGDDYLRLQVVLRDVEFYTRQVSAYVHEFLQYMSSIELVMRLQPGNYPELESKWVQFNISVRDLEKVALEEHLCQVRKHVIEPFELVIKAYGNPSLAMKKRQKRRVDYERSEQLRRGGKSPDPRLKELVEQYEALNDALKKELPQLSALTEKIGNICLGNFVNIQAKWYATWKDKMKAVLTDGSDLPDLQEVVLTFEREFPYANEQLANVGILRLAAWGKASLLASASLDDATVRPRPRPSDIQIRSRGLSVNGDVAPILPTPDFGGRHSGSFTMSPSHNAPGFANGNVPSPHQYYYRDYYAGINPGHRVSASPRSPELGSSSRSGVGTGMASTRPSTGRSHESGMPRPSSESAVQNHRDSSTTYSSNHATPETQRFSNLFHSALPMSDGPDENSSHRASRASSRERSQTSDGYNILWLAASLFEFNISTTKHEAGYPYLTYQAGEIFDVIAEKGELWLAKNQDDPSDQVGWIWSKHFAKLADS